MKNLRWKCHVLASIVIIAFQSHAGVVATGLNGPGGMVFDNGYLYFTDNSTTDGLVKRVATAGGPVETLVQGASLYDSGAWRGVGRIYIAGDYIYGDFGGYVLCQVFRAPKTGGAFTTITSGLCLGLSASDLYYFVPFNWIYSMSMSGGPATLVSTGNWPRNWQYDIDAIYFSEYFSRDVKRLDLNTHALTTLIGSNPSEGGVFINNAYVFFNIQGNIERVPKNGGPVETIVNTGTANGYAADDSNIYLVDGDAIKSVPVDGGPLITLQTVPVNSVSFLAIDNEYLYWGDTSGGPGAAQIKRILKAVTPPPAASNVKVSWATTSRSHSVAFGYDITGSVLPELSFGVYRSATRSFDPSTAVSVGSVTIANAAPGSYTRTINAELGIDPVHPYVLVVADPNNKISETNETDNTASFRKFVLGIVTHGFQLDGKFPDWVTDMCGILKTQRKYDATVAVDWAEQSRLLRWGQTYEAATRLKALVLSEAEKLHAAAEDVIDTHWIGHSRGAVVNSEVFSDFEILGMPPALSRGSVNMTMLDPHPAKNYPGKIYYSVNNTIGVPWLVESGLIEFQNSADDPEPSFSATINLAEVYFQHTPAIEAPRLEFILNLWGVETIDGMKSLTELTRSGIGHSEVHDVYLEQLRTDDTSLRLNVAPGITMSLSASASAAKPISDVEMLYPTYVNDRGVAESLVRTIAAAKAASERGDSRAQKGALKALLNEVQAQKGKHIDAGMADLLTWAADAIVQSIP